MMNRVQSTTRLKRKNFKTQAPNRKSTAPGIKQDMRSPICSHMSFNLIFLRIGKLCYRASWKCISTSCCTSLAFLIIFLALRVSYERVYRDTLFRVCKDPSPVLESRSQSAFANNPLSKFRPRNQFPWPSSSSWKTLQGRIPTCAKDGAIITIITVTKNPRSFIAQTAASLKHQSLKCFKWLIVNDHTTLKSSYNMLLSVSASLPRAELVNNTSNEGLGPARKFALAHFKKRRTKYFAFLDDDDMLELTSYEKCVWFLESIPNFDLCSFFVVGFGSKNYTWEKGLHSGRDVYSKDNPLTPHAIFRSVATIDIECDFDSSMIHGKEDWDFYLCIASKGNWGGTIPEFNIWYRNNDISFRKKRWPSLFQNDKDTTKTIRTRYKRLRRSFPNPKPSKMNSFDTINLEIPFRNNLYLSRSIMLIIPWMTIGGADYANLRLVKRFSQLGYRVTIICTLHESLREKMELRPQFMMYTHDIFTLPTMLRLKDSFRFLEYLLDSRGSTHVIVSQSQTGYACIPHLRAKFPKVAFIDYVHNEVQEWKNGGYAMYSFMSHKAIDCTFTSSRAAAEYISKKIGGFSKNTIEVAYLGIDMEKIKLRIDSDRRKRRERLGLGENDIIFTFIGRLVPEKNPGLVLDAFNIISEKYGNKYKGRPLVLVIGGDGPERKKLLRAARYTESDIRFTKSLDHGTALEYLSVSDIFSLPSDSEGIPFTLAEAMAFALVAVATDIGGMRELIRDGENGFLLNSKTSKDGILKNLIAVFDEILANWDSLGKLRTSARRTINDKFDAKYLIPKLVNKFLKCRKRGTYKDTNESLLSAMYYATELISIDTGRHADYYSVFKELEALQT